MRKAFFYIVIGVLLSLIGRLLFLIIPSSGQFTSFKTILVDQCRKIEIAPGPEDIQIDHNTGLAYISAVDRRALNNVPPGGIYVLNLNKPEMPARKLKGKLPDGFNPHGISLWHGLNGERRLFVVNHPDGKHSVEIFSLDNNDRLTHLETITSETFTSPNDLIAVGKRQFYVSNMQRASGGFRLSLELYFGLPVTNVIYFNGESAVPAATGLITANGVNVSGDGRKLYVAEVIARRINIYRRDIESGRLSERRKISIGTGPDNIDVAPDGSLFIGAHPNLLAFTEHAEDANHVSPSQVVRLHPETGNYETVFMSINGEINGSATGPYWNGHLLVGGVFDPHIMWCTDIEK